MLAIDGSVLEGGGQIIRNALSLSILTKAPIVINNIRAGRQKPGLMEQHLKGLQLLQKLCHATVKGDQIGSTQLEFQPGTLFGGQYNSVVKTAGSIGLILQASLPCAIFANSETVLKFQGGGTNAEMAPQIDYITEVFRHNLEKFNASFDFSLIRRGYFPKGEAQVEVTVKPIIGCLSPVNLLNFGEIRAVYGWSYVAGRLPLSLAHDLANSAVKILKRFYHTVNIERYKETKQVAPIGDSSGVILVVGTSTNCILGGSALSRKQETPVQTAQRACDELIRCIESKCCVDEHCQDQIIIFMALAEGKSQVKVGEITMHTKTSIYVAELLTKCKFNIIKQEDGTNILECEGIGLKS